MDIRDKEDIICLLKDELQGFFGWIVNEIGIDYYLDDLQNASDSLGVEARRVVSRRIAAKRLQLWERDWYSFFHDPKHPSIYELFKADDLEIVHYLEDLSCEHFKAQDMAEDTREILCREHETRSQDSFGVLVASQVLGWMYRLDFCETCGLVEVWSMGYNPDEISLYTVNP